MTVLSTTDSRKVVPNSGFSNPIVFNQYVEDTTHLKVYADQNLMTIGVDYTLAGVGTDPDVEVTITPAGLLLAPTNWVVLHDPPIEQGSDLSLGGRFGLAYEQAIDAVTRRFQAIAERLSRNLSLPIDSLIGTVDFPPPVASRGIRWNSTATGLENTDGPIDEPGTSAAAAAASAAQAAAYAVDAGDEAVAAAASAVAAAGSASTASTQAGNAATSAAAAAASASTAQAASDNLHPPVRAATTGNVTIATALNNGDTIDGVVLATGDRVLVCQQTTAAENGIYVVGVSPARASDMDTWSEATAAIVVVQEGTANADTMWICTANAGGTIGVTSMTWELALDLKSTATATKVTVFTANGTYTPDSRMRDWEAHAWAGGGAGGGAPATGATQFSGGGGGQGGAYAYGRFTKAQAGASQTITIGPGGTGVAGLAGNDGTDTSVGALLVAAGGKGGGIRGPIANTSNAFVRSNPTLIQSSAGTVRGWTIVGGDGLLLTVDQKGGDGGSTSLGGAGIGRDGASGGGGAAKANTGSGGGGAMDLASAAATAGGAGGSGLVIIIEHLTI